MFDGWNGLVGDDDFFENGAIYLLFRLEIVVEKTVGASNDFHAQTAVGKRACLSIFGNDYPTPDGTCLRDYIDIVDLARAHVFAVTRMIEGKMKEDCEVFNIGTGRPLSVLELVTAFEKVNGVPVPHKFAPRRPGDVTAIWADPTLANEEMGWRATRTIEQTLAAAWAWEKHLAGK